MNPTTTRKLAIAVVVILVILIAVWFIVARYEEYLTGFWEADSTWASEAGLDSAYLKLAPVSSGWLAWTTRRAGYLVMARGGETVYNGPIELAYSSWWSRMWTASWTPTARYHISSVAVTEFGGAAKDGDADAEPLIAAGAGGITAAPGGAFPANLSLTASILNGSLALTTKEVVWGFFYKNHEASADE